MGVERMIANKKIWQFVKKQEENSRPPVAKAVCTILCTILLHLPGQTMILFTFIISRRSLMLFTPIHYMHLIMVSNVKTVKEQTFHKRSDI